MKLSVLQENINKGLSIVSRSVSSKATLPILTNILIGTDNGRLKLSSTNLETGVNLWIGAKIEEEGAIAIPAKILTEFISSLPADKVDFETKESILYITSGSFKANISGMDSMEFPSIPSFSKDPFLSLSKEELIKALSQVSIAAAQDEGRPVLTGVLIKTDGKSVSLVATDGYRLSMKRIPVIESKTESSLLVPAKTLLEVCRISQDTSSDTKEIKLSLTAEKSQLVFSLPDVEFSSRLIEGTFPDYEKIIPHELTVKASFDREGFLRAVKSASIFAREQANIIKLSIGDGKMIVSAETPHLGSNEIGVEAKTEGEKMEIAFNYRFLLDFLNVVNSDEVIFEAGGTLSPGVFKGSQEDTFLHIIMPVRLQS